jgi:ribosomal protein S18 acetylase RimI-like enzyme
MIREANLKDIEELAQLFDEYRVFYKKSTDLKGAIDFLTKRIANSESKIFIVLSGDGRMAGFVQLYPIFSSTRMKLLWLLNDLYVHNKYRKMGLGEQLIDRAKELARSTDSCGLLLETSKSNTVANELYVKTDFALSTQENFYTWEC